MVQADAITVLCNGAKSGLDSLAAVTRFKIGWRPKRLLHGRWMWRTALLCRVSVITLTVAGTCERSGELAHGFFLSTHTLFSFFLGDACYFVS